MIIPVDRGALVKVLKKNRDAHNGIFREAVEGYRAKALEKLNGYIDDVKAGKIIDTYWHLPTPDDHTDEYDRIIGLLEMSTDKKVSMSDVEYEAYVLDKWRWKEQFLMSNAGYSYSANLALQQGSTNP